MLGTAGLRWCEHCGGGPWHCEMRAEGRAALKSQAAQTVGTFRCLLARHWLGGDCVSCSIPDAGIWAVAEFVHQHTQQTQLLVLAACLAADSKDHEMETQAYHRKRHLSADRSPEMVFWGLQVQKPSRCCSDRRSSLPLLLLLI